MEPPSHSLVLTPPLPGFSQALSSHPSLLHYLSLYPALYPRLSLCLIPLSSAYSILPPIPHHCQSLTASRSGSWFPLVSLVSLEYLPFISLQEIPMPLPRAWSDPGCQPCQAQNIGTFPRGRCVLLGPTQPLISLGLDDVGSLTLFSQVVVRELKVDSNMVCAVKYKKNIYVHVLPYLMDIKESVHKKTNYMCCTGIHTRANKTEQLQNF